MSGQLMTAEMAEQPARLRALIERAPTIADQIRAILPDPLTGITIVARGSSDHAAVYGRYLLEAATGKPVSLAAPSLHTHYGIQADYSGQLVIAISQSGETPEIVRTLESLQRSGARGLGVTNERESPLSHAADLALVLDVGRELAVPATKTVTGQFVAMALIADALGGRLFTGSQLADIPGWVQAAIDDRSPTAAVAAALAPSPQLVVTARGYMYAAALETALKIKETCYVPAQGYSSADLRHGPIAAVTGTVPVLAMASPGPVAQDVLSLVSELRSRGTVVHLIAAEQDAEILLPSELPETLAPIVATVRGQQLAYELALALGHDPDRPLGLNKVTLT